MQSFLQYRRFGRHVQAQYERDRKRAEALEKGNTSNASAPPFSPQEPQIGHRSASIDTTSSSTEVPSSSLDTRDPEKAEQPSSGQADPDFIDTGGSDTATEGADIIHTTATNHSFGTHMGQTLTGVEVRQLSQKLSKIRTSKSTNAQKSTNTNKKTNEPELETVFVVGYESSQDPLNPHNWSYGTRIFCTIMIAWIGFIVGLLVLSIRRRCLKLVRNLESVM